MHTHTYVHIQNVDNTYPIRVGCLFLGTLTLFLSALGAIIFMTNKVTASRILDEADSGGYVVF